MMDLNDIYRRINLASERLGNCNGNQMMDERKTLKQLAENLVDAVRDAADLEKPYLLLDAGIAAYRSGHYARAQQLIHQRSILPRPRASMIEKMLDSFIAKNFQRLDTEIAAVIANLDFSDTNIARSLQQRHQLYPEFGLEDGAVLQVINRIAADCLRQVLDFAHEGNQPNLQDIHDRLTRCEHIVLAINQPSWGWRINCLRWLMEEFVANSLWTHLAAWTGSGESGTRSIHQYIRAHYERDNPVIELWASQICALPYVNDPARKSFVLSMPTNSGKTRIAELLILRFLLDSENEPDTKVIYIAPLRRLASEIQDTLFAAFRNILSRPESISRFYGGREVDPLDQNALSAARILICTPEKLDGLLRQNPELRPKIRLVIADEGHIIGDDDDRGWRYRMLIERLIRMLNTKVPYEARKGARLCLLSGVLPNADDFASWISGDSTATAKTTWSAAEKPEFKTMIWDNEAKQLINEGTGNAMSMPYMQGPDGIAHRPVTIEHAVSRCAIGFARQGHTMVFSANKARLKGEALLDPLLSDLKQHPQFEPRVIPDILRRQSDTEHERVCHLLVQGVALHHADLPAQLKAYIENEYIAEGHAKLVLATPTLMQGVNIPVSVLIILEMSHQGRVRPGATGDLTPAQFQNLVGRVGRAGVHMQDASLRPTVWFVVDKTKQYLASATVKLRNVLLQSYDGYRVSSAFIHHLVELKKVWLTNTRNPDMADLVTCLAEHRLKWLTDEKERSTVDSWLQIIDSHLDALRIESHDSQVDIVDWLQINLSQILDLLVGAAEVDPGDYDFVRHLLQARGRYMQRTPTEERLRQYLLGLPFQDCKQIEAARDELLDWYLNCVGLFAGDPSSGIQSLCRLISFASQLSVVSKQWRPKKPKKLPRYAGQQMVLALEDGQNLYGDPFSALWSSWVLGDTEAEVANAFTEVFGEGKNFDAYLEHVIGYEMPWAMSAICRYLGDIAKERSMKLTRDFDFLPMLVKTGVPNIASALIAQDGFSRNGSMKLAGVIDQHMFVLDEDGAEAIDGFAIVTRTQIATLLSQISEDTANRSGLDPSDAKRLSLRKSKS